VNLLKEHAKEARDNLESSLNQNFETPEKTNMQGKSIQHLLDNSNYFLSFLA